MTSEPLARVNRLSDTKARFEVSAEEGRSEAPDVPPRSEVEYPRVGYLCLACLWLRFRLFLIRKLHLPVRFVRIPYKTWDALRSRLPQTDHKS